LLKSQCRFLHCLQLLDLLPLVSLV